jgi:hypothetical protein
LFSFPPRSGPFLHCRCAAAAMRQVDQFDPNPSCGILAIAFIGVRRWTRFGQVSLGGESGNGEAALCGLRRGVPTARKSRIRRTAARWPVSERDDDVRDGPSGRAMPTTAIGASIGARISSAARATALRRDAGTGCEDGRVKGGFAVPSGAYQLVPASAVEFAKMDALSRPYGEAAELCEETT